MLPNDPPISTLGGSINKTITAILSNSEEEGQLLHFFTRSENGNSQLRKIDRALRSEGRQTSNLKSIAFLQGMKGRVQTRLERLISRVEEAEYILRTNYGSNVEAISKLA